MAPRGGDAPLLAGGGWEVVDWLHPLRGSCTDGGEEFEEFFAVGFGPTDGGFWLAGDEIPPVAMEGDDLADEGR
jgi:hypothetical protein